MTLGRKMLLVWAILMVAASAGCAGADVAPTPTPTPKTTISTKDLAQRVETAIDSVQTAQGTLLVTTKGGIRNYTFRSLVWFKKPTSAKLQIIDSPDGGMPNGTKLTFDGKSISISDPETGKVVRMDDLGEASSLLTLSGNLNLFLFELLKFQPFLADPDTSVHDYSASLIGTDTTAERPTNVILLEPTQPKAPVGQVRLWVTEQEWLPLKIQLTSADGKSTLVLEFESFETNVPLADDVFSAQ